MSTREIGKFMERILGNAYSPATISRITDVVKEDIEKWRTRPLHKRYSVLYLDGLYVKLRRETVEKEVIYVVFVKADDKIPNIAGIKFPTYNRTIVSMRGAMVHDYERGIFYDQRDV